MVPKLHSLSIIILKKGLNDKFKSIIEETLIDTQERENIKHLYQFF